MMRFAAIGATRLYWLALFGLALGLEAVALVYQYRFEYWPCVLCIHVRIWVLGMMLVGLLGLLLRRSQAGRAAGHLLTAIVAAGMLERSWKLFAIERGIGVAGECSFDTGLPPWFALDQWYPSVFKVWEACGYTPQLLLGITMAEALIALSATLLVLAVCLLIASLRPPAQTV